MPYNPYQQYPYPQPQYNPYQQPQNTYAFVNGIEGAKSYQIGPNQTVILMDSDNPLVYMKQSNAMGQCTIKCFKLVETTESELKAPQPKVDYVTKDEFSKLCEKIARLEKKGE